jgi:hypothetical protein
MTVTGVQQAQMTTLAIRAHGVKAALFGKDKWVGMAKAQVMKLPSKPIKIVRMSKKLHMVKTKQVPDTSSVYDLALSMVWGLEINSPTGGDSDKIETCDVFEVNANLKHLEETHDEVDWLLLDTGSTVHICRDRNKLHNLTRRTTRIRGVNGGQITKSELIGDWNLVLRDKFGKFHKFTLRNVVLFPEASRDIIGTGRLEKSGWWPHIQHKELYHQDDARGLPKFPFYNTKKRLKVIPSVRLPPAEKYQEKNDYFQGYCKCNGHNSKRRVAQSSRCEHGKCIHRSIHLFPVVWW